MPQVTYSITIERPLDQVWDFLTNLENTPKWDIGVRETRVTSQGLAGLGTTFQNIGPFLGRESVRDYEVTTYDPQRKVSVTLRTPSKVIRRAEVTYAFDAVPNGTRLTFVGLIEFAGMFKVLQPIITRRAEEDGRGDLANLKKLLETAPNPA